MRSFDCIIHDPVGIHARPAGMLAREVKKYPGTRITITKGDRTVEANQLMKLIGMGVKCNDRITVSCNGGNESAALDAMKDFFADQFRASIL